MGGWMGGWVGGWVDGWLENEFLKKTPSPKFGLESQFGTSDLEFVNTSKTEGESLYDYVKKLYENLTEAKGKLFKQNFIV